MAVSASRSVSVTFTGDVSATHSPAVAVNAQSPGTLELLAAAVGFNAIPVPLAGAVPTALTIIPPAGNTNALTLKGVTGDTGIRLHNTDPTVIALDPTVTSIGITVGTAITNLRLVWS